MNEKIALILEGGGFRGIFTSGVLDYFMENNLYFNYVSGVSMGACNAVSYISRQKERNKNVLLKYVDDKRYLSISNLIREKSLFGMNFVFKKIPRELVPFDYDTFFKSKTNFVIGVTDCITGEAIYLDGKNKEMENILMASSSLPFISKMVKLNNSLYLDGGISDSIPIQKAIDDGYQKMVVVLTRPKGYRKKAFKLKKMCNYYYKKFPNLANAILNRHKLYNETIEKIEKLEQNGSIFVIRPNESLEIGRVEKNKEKLMKVYIQGVMQAERDFQNLIKFLK